MKRNKTRPSSRVLFIIRVLVVGLTITQIVSWMQFHLISSVEDSGFPLPTAHNNTSTNIHKSYAASPKIKLIHVLNAYSVLAKTTGPNNTHQMISPLDQSVTIQSILRAQTLAPTQLEVDLVCAMFPHDIEALPNLPCRKIRLRRSTKTEYPSFSDGNQPPKELPFIGDIIQAAVEAHHEEQRQEKGNDYKNTPNKKEDFFILLTNSDISLTQTFYPFVYEQITKERRDAFTINRLTIPNKLLNKTTSNNAPNDLLIQVDSLLDQGQKHPGYDCFIFHASLLKRFTFDNMFAGHPPWGGLLMGILRIMADNFAWFPSTVRQTFHLGDDQSKWARRAKGKLSNYNNSTHTSILEHDHRFANTCPLQLFGDHPYTILNTINCGKLFDYYSPHDRRDRLYHNHTIPLFVKPGYEQRYLDNSHRAGIRYQGPGGRGRPRYLKGKAKQSG